MNMIIKTLVENTSSSEEFKNQHGLSLYIETKKHKILFDLGANEMFADNAKIMNIDLSEVDLVIISHGHYDHGGGLAKFLQINSKAKVYLNKNAFEKHYAYRENGEKRYIGLDEKLISNNRFVFINNQMIIDDELELFSNVHGSKFNPSGNESLYMERDNTFVQDDFSHEQNLIIKYGTKTILLAGCAHNGIINIIEHIKNMKKDMPDYIIGGFHLCNSAGDKYENPSTIYQIGNYLKNTNSKYCTCHCTGIIPYGILKEVMGDKIDYLSAGSELII
jgi:7,8-dihydropterin-6-yl-methyl-4-(beta-D-ribofuranosyl)aminobenzene 5'-phosphate synthase